MDHTFDHIRNAARYLGSLAHGKTASLDMPTPSTDTKPHVINPSATFDKFELQSDQPKHPTRVLLMQYSLTDLKIIEKEATDLHERSSLSTEQKQKAFELACHARTEFDEHIRALAGC